MVGSAAEPGSYAAHAVKAHLYDAYLVTNKISGLQYVGVTSRGIALRWQRHITKANNGSKLLLHRAIREFGPDSFSVEHLACAVDLASLWALETQIISQRKTVYPDGYNASDGRQGGRPYRFTPEQIKRISMAHLGHRHTPEARAKIGAASRGRLHSDATKAKMSEVQRRRAADPAYRARLSAAMKGRVIDPAAAKRAADAYREMLADPVRFAKWRAERIGRKRSDESRGRMRESRNRFLEQSPRAGELSGKLKVEQVAEIKRLLLDGLAQTEIAARFGIRQTQVSNIKNGRSWRGVAPSPPLELPPMR